MSAIWVLCGVAEDGNETAPIMAACATRELAEAAVERMLGPDVVWHADSLGFDLTDSGSYLLGRVLPVVVEPSGLLALDEFEPSDDGDDTSDDDGAA